LDGSKKVLGFDYKSINKHARRRQKKKDQMEQELENGIK
jgi:hypothetical protein